MLSDVVGYLQCPFCASGLAVANGALRCEAGHSFDVARQGYDSLLPAGAGAARGDTAAMVAARERFLAAGHYDPLSEAIGSRAVATRIAGCVLDLGAGTGHHLAHVLDALDDGAAPTHDAPPDRVGLALDSSKYALRRAARAHARIGAVACDAWRALPVRDHAAALVLSVFAPRDAAEIARVLAPGGTVLAVTPTPRHLAELVAALGLLRVDAGKPERLDEKLAPALTLSDRHTLEWELRLTRADAADAAAMGPSAWHADPAALAAAVAALPEPLVTTAAVTISAYGRSARIAQERV
jgi:23S rRNA (guanine745-N1)-methyltransferase